MKYKVEEIIKTYNIKVARAILKDNKKYPARSADEHTARQLAIQALEKQIPYKPTDIGYEYTREKIGTCKCGNGAVLEHQKYCEECGQRLDWEEAGA